MLHGSEMEESFRKSALGTTRLVPCLLQSSENREGIESSWIHLCFSSRVCRFCNDDFSQRTEELVFEGNFWASRSGGSPNKRWDEANHHSHCVPCVQSQIDLGAAAPDRDRIRNACGNSAGGAGSYGTFRQ
jgi:hypothetical protein